MRGRKRKALATGVDTVGSKLSTLVQKISSLVQENRSLRAENERLNAQIDEFGEVVGVLESAAQDVAAPTHRAEKARKKKSGRKRRHSGESGSKKQSVEYLFKQRHYQHNHWRKRRGLPDIAIDEYVRQILDGKIASRTPVPASFAYNTKMEQTPHEKELEASRNRQEAEQRHRDEWRAFNKSRPGKAPIPFDTWLRDRSMNIDRTARGGS